MTGEGERLAALLATPSLAPVLAALPRARLVGGCVRDTLAARPVADIDLATPEPPDQVRAALQAAGLRVIPTGLAHGTLTALSFGQAFEVTTLRRDAQTDGRHAQVVWTEDFDADAARRDFTFNALSLDQGCVLHDPFGGLADLLAGRVRFVGDPALRIAEDRLRILRFFRFHARYAAGPPDPAATQAIADGVPGLAMLSAERVWSETRLILATPEPMRAVALMDRLGVLAALLPQARDVARLDRLVQAGAPADPLLRLAALLDGEARALAGRLRLSNSERDTLLALSAGPVPQPGDDDAQLRRLLADVPAEMLCARSWLAGGQADQRRRLEAMPRPVFPLEGRHALALGAAPGVLVGQALQRTRAWWMLGGCVAGEQACLKHLAVVLEGKKGFL